MPWQDWVITIGQLILALALLPSIFSKQKPAVATSILTGLILYIFSFVFLTLSLLLSSGVIFATAILWTVLAYQKRRKGK